MYKLITTKNCSKCDNVKRFINTNNLNIIFEDIKDEMLEIFRNTGVRSYPILINDRGTNGFTIIENGEQVGYYLAENIDKFRGVK